MRKLSAAAFLAMLVSCGMSGPWQPHPTIQDIARSPSVYTDSLVTVRDVTVLEVQSVLNLSRSVVTDGSGGELILVDNKPHKRGEHLSSMTGRYQVLVSYGGVDCQLFVAEGLRYDVVEALEDLQLIYDPE